MPIALSPQSEIVQTLIEAASSLPLSNKQRLLWHRIVSSLKQPEQKTIAELFHSDAHLAKTFIINTLAKYDCLKANDTPGIEKILQDDATLLAK